MTDTRARDRGVSAELTSTLISALKDADRVKAAVVVLFSAGTAYVLGGIVFALRLNQASFPVQDSLEVVPESVLLVGGIRELFISSVVAILLLALMLVLSASERVPDIVSMSIVPVLLLMVVPLNAGGLVWPAALAVLGFLFARMKRQMRKNVVLNPTASQILAVALVIVFLVTFAALHGASIQVPGRHLVAETREVGPRSPPVRRLYRVLKRIRLPGDAAA